MPLLKTHVCNESSFDGKTDPVEDVACVELIAEDRSFIF
jgi:hypothetical protein